MFDKSSKSWDCQMIVTLFKNASRLILLLWTLFFNFMYVIFLLLLLILSKRNLNLNLNLRLIKTFFNFLSIFFCSSNCLFKLFKKSRIFFLKRNLFFSFIMLKKNRNRSLKNFMLTKFDNVMLQFKIEFKKNRE